MPISLKDAVKKRILVDSLKSVHSPGKWKVLVVEENALRILNSVCDLHDLSDVNVQVTESLSNRKRNPYPDKEAIYFLSSSPEAIEALINDFRGPKPMYAAAHIFCISALPDALFDHLKRSPARNYIQALKELNIDFTPFESQVYHFNEQSSFTKLRNASDESELDRMLNQIAEQMKSVFWTLEDCPSIRYFDPSGRGDSLSAHMAFKLEGAIDQLKEVDPEWPPESPYPPAQIIVLDRTVDVFAPLIHSLTYQAAIYDLLQVEGTKVMYTKGDTADSDVSQTAVLDESDMLYKQIRHQFIADACQVVAEALSKLSANTSANESADALKRIEALKAMLYNLPEAQKTKEKSALHLHLQQEIMQLVKERLLEDVANIEQTIVTGEYPDGRTIDNKLAEELMAVLEKRDVPLQDKLRLILTYVLGVRDADLPRMAEIAQLGHEVTALNGLAHLGPLPKVPDPKNAQWRYTDFGRKFEKRNQRKKGKDDEEQPFHVHRYVPALKYILQDAISNNLDPTLFPSTKDLPSGSKGGTADGVNRQHVPGKGNIVAFKGDFKPTWGKRKPVAGAHTNVDLRTNGSRIIVLFVDGISFPEIRVGYEVTAECQREVVVGSPSLMTPTDFIECLRELGSSGKPPLILPPARRTHTSNLKPATSAVREQKPLPPAPSEPGTTISPAASVSVSALPEAIKYDRPHLMRPPLNHSRSSSAIATGLTEGEKISQMDMRRNSAEGRRPVSWVSPTSLNVTPPLPSRTNDVHPTPSASFAQSAQRPSQSHIEANVSQAQAPSYGLGSATTTPTPAPSNQSSKLAPQAVQMPPSTSAPPAPPRVHSVPMNPTEPTSYANTEKPWQPIPARVEARPPSGEYSTQSDGRQPIPADNSSRRNMGYLRMDARREEPVTAGMPHRPVQQKPPANRPLSGDMLQNPVGSGPPTNATLESSQSTPPQSTPPASKFPPRSKSRGQPLVAPTNYSPPQQGNPLSVKPSSENRGHQHGREDDMDLAMKLSMQETSKEQEELNKALALSMKESQPQRNREREEAYKAAIAASLQDKGRDSWRQSYNQTGGASQQVQNTTVGGSQAQQPSIHYNPYKLSYSATSATAPNPPTTPPYPSPQTQARTSPHQSQYPMTSSQSYFPAYQPPARPLYRQGAYRQAPPPQASTAQQPVAPSSQPGYPYYPAPPAQAPTYQQPTSQPSYPYYPAPSAQAAAPHQPVPQAANQGGHPYYPATQYQQNAPAYRPPRPVFQQAPIPSQRNMQGTGQYGGYPPPQGYGNGSSAGGHGR